VEQQQCLSVFGPWRCQLELGYRGVHHARSAQEEATWSDSLSGQQLHDM